MASTEEVANFDCSTLAAEVASLPQVTMPAVLLFKSQSAEFRVSTRRPPPTSRRPPEIEEVEVKERALNCWRSSPPRSVEVAVEVPVKKGKESVSPKFAFRAKRLPVKVEVPVLVLVRRPDMVTAGAVKVPVIVGEAERTTEPQVPVTSVIRRMNSEQVSIEVEEILLLRVVQLSTVKAFEVMRRPVPVRSVTESLPNLNEVSTLRAVVVASVVVALPRMVRPVPNPPLMVVEPAMETP